MNELDDLNYLKRILNENREKHEIRLIRKEEYLRITNGYCANIVKLIETRQIDLSGSDKRLINLFNVLNTLNLPYQLISEIYDKVSTHLNS